MLKRLKSFLKTLDDSNTVGKAAETAFFLLLSIFPLGMVISEMLARLGISNFAKVLEIILPYEIAEFITAPSGTERATSAPLFLIGSLWSASAGIWALMRGVYHAYTSKRLSSIKARMFAIAFTIGFIAAIAGTLALLVLNWLVVLSVSLIIIFLLLFALYTLLPGIKARPKRAAFAAVFAAAGWYVLSRAFEIYMTYIVNYTVLYGSIGIFLGLALWIFCLCLLILICAEWIYYDIN